MELECTAHPNPTTVVGVEPECTYSGADWGGTHSSQLLLKILSSSDLLFLKLPFAVRPGLTDSRVANLIVLSNCTTKMKVEMITVQGSSVKQWVQAQYTGLVSWVIIST